MNVVSVNVGLPREVTYKGKRLTTGIFKEPVEGRTMLRRLNLDGDRQADLSVHGGPSKAVYAYPSEHYEYWRQQLREDRVNIGDRFRIGSAHVMVTEPRLPCHKLAAKFGRDDIIKRFLHSGRTGFYFAVLQEGEVGAGDQITVIGRDKHGVTVADITRLYVHDKDDVTTLRRAVQVEALPESWRGYFQKRIEKLLT
jgi:MOSC domain-containing protein YiiM